MFNMSLLLSCVDELSIVESPLVLLHYCLLFPSCMLVFAYGLGAPMSSTYIFTTILSSWWINTFIIKQLPCVYYSSSLKVSFMWRKCSLSPGGVKMKWVLHVVPQKGSWWLVLLSLSQKQGLTLTGEFPLGAKQCSLEGWDDVGKMELFFLPILCSYSQIFSSSLFLFHLLAGIL